MSLFATSGSSPPQLNQEDLLQKIKNLEQILLNNIKLGESQRIDNDESKPSIESQYVPQKQHLLDQLDALIKYTQKKLDNIHFFKTEEHFITESKCHEKTCEKEFGVFAETPRHCRLCGFSFCGEHCSFHVGSSTFNGLSVFGRVCENCNVNIVGSPLSEGHTHAGAAAARHSELQTLLDSLKKQRQEITVGLESQAGGGVSVAEVNKFWSFLTANRQNASSSSEMFCSLFGLNQILETIHFLQQPALCDSIEDIVSQISALDSSQVGVHHWLQGGKNVAELSEMLPAPFSVPLQIISEILQSANMTVCCRGACIELALRFLSLAPIVAQLNKNFLLKPDAEFVQEQIKNISDVCSDCLTFIQEFMPSNPTEELKKDSLAVNFCSWFRRPEKSHRVKFAAEKFVRLHFRLSSFLSRTTLLLQITASIDDDDLSQRTCSASQQENNETTPLTVSIRDLLLDEMMCIRKHLVETNHKLFNEIKNVLQDVINDLARDREIHKNNIDLSDDAATSTSVVEDIVTAIEEEVSSNTQKQQSRADNERLLMLLRNAASRQVHVEAVKLLIPLYHPLTTLQRLRHEFETTTEQLEEERSKIETAIVVFFRDELPLELRRLTAVFHHTSSSSSSEADNILRVAHNDGFSKEFNFPLLHLFVRLSLGGGDGGGGGGDALTAAAELFPFLLETGKPFSNLSPMQYAISRGNSAALKTLLDHLHSKYIPSRPDRFAEFVIDINDLSCLDLAIQHNAPECVEVIVNSFNADLLERKIDKLLPKPVFMEELRLSKADAICKLLTFKPFHSYASISVLLPNLGTRTPLLVCMQNISEVLPKLVFADISQEQVDDDEEEETENSDLLTIERSLRIACSLIFDAGANPLDPSTFGNDGKTAQDFFKNELQQKLKSQLILQTKSSSSPLVKKIISHLELLATKFDSIEEENQQQQQQQQQYRHPILAYFKKFEIEIEPEEEQYFNSNDSMRDTSIDFLLNASKQELKSELLKDVSVCLRDLQTEYKKQFDQDALKLLEEIRQKFPKQMIFSFLDVEVGNRLAGGTFGEVHEAVLTKTDPQTKATTKLNVVAKIPRERRYNFGAIDEASNFWHRKHPNIIDFEGIYVRPRETNTTFPHVVLLLRRADGNMLRIMESLRKKKGSEFLKSIYSHTFDIACGLKYLHSNSLHHYDLKPANLLFYRNNSNTPTSSPSTSRKEILLKITDLGATKQVKQQQINSQTTRANDDDDDQLGAKFTAVATLDHGHTVNYAAPEYFLAVELRQPLRMSAAFDIYSVGVILHEMLFGKMPEIARDVLEMDKLVKRIARCRCDRENKRIPNIDGVVAVSENGQQQQKLHVNEEAEQIPSTVADSTIEFQKLSLKSVCEECLRTLPKTIDGKRFRIHSAKELLRRLVQSCKTDGLNPNDFVEDQNDLNNLDSDNDDDDNNNNYNGGDDKKQINKNNNNEDDEDDHNVFGNEEVDEEEQSNVEDEQDHQQLNNQAHQRPSNVPSDVASSTYQQLETNDFSTGSSSSDGRGKLLLNPVSRDNCNTAHSSMKTTDY